MLAVEGGHAQCTNTLLGGGASVDLCDADKRTGLHRAASLGSEDCVTALLEAKASVLLQDCRGKTAVHYAAAMGHVNVLKLLLQNCDPQVAISILDAQNCTPLHWAAFKGARKSNTSFEINVKHPFVCNVYRLRQLY